MSDSRSRLEDIGPLGKSVEEIERDTQNRVNSDAPDEGNSLPESGLAVVPPVNFTSAGLNPGTTALGTGMPEVPLGPVLRPGEDEERRD